MLYREVSGACMGFSVKLIMFPITPSYDGNICAHNLMNDITFYDVFFFVFCFCRCCSVPRTRYVYLRVCVCIYGTLRELFAQIYKIIVVT